MGITNNMLIFHIRCKKKEKGIITEKNYSDLLKLSLLSEQGEMWLSATF